ncbi:hypothetical protein [Streptomyces sp. NRRL F-5135]|uniref:hypothetical protein n=1 Tax=Streptomyces sp. NRRL F-5135 TaxID=1463858 RepID=UPI0004C82018|nr:hypothetical protein [Streptomyces sp. NRRL F-5135]
MLSNHDVVLCSTCRARIRWALTTANGRRQPVNAEPDALGNLAVSRGPDGRLYVRSLTRAHPEPRAGEYRMMPHHATCAARPSWRRT